MDVFADSSEMAGFCEELSVGDVALSVFSDTVGASADVLKDVEELEIESVGSAAWMALLSPQDAAKSPVTDRHRSFVRRRRTSCFFGRMGFSSFLALVIYIH